MNKYKSKLSVLIDDRGAVIYNGGVAMLKPSRANEMLAAFENCLELLEEKKDPAKKQQKKQQDDGQEFEVDTAQGAVSAFNLSKKRKLASKLAGRPVKALKDVNGILDAASEQDILNAIDAI